MAAKLTDNKLRSLARFAFNYVETLLRSLQNPSKLGSYSLACAFATRVA